MHDGACDWQVTEFQRKNQFVTNEAKEEGSEGLVGNNRLIEDTVEAEISKVNSPMTGADYGYRSGVTITL